MVELMVERWSYPDGREEFFWSLWQDGSRLKFSDRLGSSAEAESEGQAFCRQALGAAPDRVTHL